MGGILAGFVSGMGQGAANVGAEMGKQQDTLDLESQKADLERQKIQYAAELQQQMATKLRVERAGALADSQAQLAHQRGVSALQANGYEDAADVKPEDVRAGDLEADAAAIYNKAVEDPRGTVQDAIRARQAYGDDKAAQEAAAADAAQTNSQANLAYKSAWGGIAERRSDIREKMVDVAEKRAGIAQQRVDQQANSPLTSSQRVKNTEIDVARRKIAALSPDDIKIMTSKTTATGRANPKYDPQLASRVKLAGKRKFGDDPAYDAALGGDATGDDTNLGDSAANDDGATPSVGSTALERFAADSSMEGMRPGRETPNGIEVFDKTGRLVGHYR